MRPVASSTGGHRVARPRISKVSKTPVQEIYRIKNSKSPDDVWERIKNQVKRLNK